MFVGYFFFTVATTSIANSIARPAIFKIFSTINITSFQISNIHFLTGLSFLLLFFFDGDNVECEIDTKFCDVQDCYCHIITSFQISNIHFLMGLSFLLLFFYGGDNAECEIDTKFCDVQDCYCHTITSFQISNIHFLTGLSFLRKNYSQNVNHLDE